MRRLVVVLRMRMRSMGSSNRVLRRVHRLGQRPRTCIIGRGWVWHKVVRHGVDRVRHGKGVMRTGVHGRWLAIRLSHQLSLVLEPSLTHQKESYNVRNQKCPGFSTTHIEQRAAEAQPCTSRSWWLTGVSFFASAAPSSLNHVAPASHSSLVCHTPTTPDHPGWVSFTPLPTTTNLQTSVYTYIKYIVVYILYMLNNINFYTTI